MVGRRRMLLSWRRDGFASGAYTVRARWVDDHLPRLLSFQQVPLQKQVPRVARCARSLGMTTRADYLQESMEGSVSPALKRGLGKSASPEGLRGKKHRQRNP